MGLASAPPELSPGRLELGSAGRRDGDTLGLVMSAARRTGAFHGLLPDATGGDTPNPREEAHALGTKKPPIPGWGRAVSGSWYHPTSPSPVATASLCTARRSAMQRPCNGSRSARLSHPSPPTEPGVLPSCSERSSAVFFAGVPGPALQQPRFSAPFPPGTRSASSQIRRVLRSLP